MKKTIIKCKKCGKKAEGIDKSFYETAVAFGWEYDKGTFTCDECGKPLRKKIIDDGKKDYKKRYPEDN